MEITYSKKIADLKPSAIREIFKSLTDPSVISFAAGNPAPESFPVDAFNKFSNEIFASQSTLALQYGITEGYGPLRNAIFDRNKRIFNVGNDFDTCIVTTGGQQGIDLVCRVLCNEGDTVICEEPSFIGALNSFRSYGCSLAGVPIDDDGINVEALENAIKNNPNAKFIYLIPTFQNPSGITMSEAKRKACYDLAKKYNILIFEDNPYGELRFSGEDIKPIKSLDNSGHVIYCSSFSKILSAGMRVGYLILNEDIARKISVAKQCADVHTPMLFQLLCHKFLTEFDLDGHISNIRKLYARKCKLMLDSLDSLDSLVRDEIEYTRPDGGLFIWGKMPERLDPKAFIAKLVENKLAVVPGATFMCDGEATCHGFRMNYSTPSDEQIVKGVEILANALKN